MNDNRNTLTSAPSLKELFRSMPLQTYAKGEVLIHRSDKIRHFYVIESGYVKVYTIDDNGEEVTIMILGAKDMYPLLKNPEQSESRALYYYESLTPTTIGIISQADLLNQIKSDREASWALLRYISEFTSNLTARLAQVEGKKAEQKLENLFPYLIDVCGKEISANRYRLDLKLTHQEIARLIGTTRETVSREIKKMESEGYISYDDGYLVLTDRSLA